MQGIGTSEGIIFIKLSTTVQDYVFPTKNLPVPKVVQNKAEWSWWGEKKTKQYV